MRALVEGRTSCALKGIDIPKEDSRRAFASRSGETHVVSGVKRDLNADSRVNDIVTFVPEVQKGACFTENSRGLGASTS